MSEHEKKQHAHETEPIEPADGAAEPVSPTDPAESDLPVADINTPVNDPTGNPFPSSPPENA